MSSPLFGVKTNYDPLRDFEPIGMLADLPFVVAVPTALPANNIRELIDLYDVGDGRKTQREVTIDKCRGRIELLKQQRADIDHSIDELEQFITVVETAKSAS